VGSVGFKPHAVTTVRASTVFTKDDHRFKQPRRLNISMAATSTTLDFTATSAFSIAGVFGALVFAYVGLTKLLPKTASRTDKITFLWLVSDPILLRTSTEGTAVDEVSA